MTFSSARRRRSLQQKGSRVFQRTQLIVSLHARAQVPSPARRRRGCGDAVLEQRSRGRKTTPHSTKWKQNTSSVLPSAHQRASRASAPSSRKRKLASASAVEITPPAQPCWNTNTRRTSTCRSSLDRRCPITTFTAWPASTTPAGRQSMVSRAISDSSFSTAIPRRSPSRSRSSRKFAAATKPVASRCRITSWKPSSKPIPS